VARRGKTRDKTKRRPLWAGILKTKAGRQAGAPTHRLRGALQVAAGVCVVAAIVFGVIRLDKYVRQTHAASQNTFALELVGPPPWVNDELKGKVYAAAKSASKETKLDESTAVNVQRSIESLVPWLHEVTVTTMADRVRVSGSWRKPLALVEWGPNSCYVDVESVVLDFVPMPNLPIVKVKGLSLIIKAPQPGETWQREDLAAAVAVLAGLDRMDSQATPDKPLLYEIASIDVSNFRGRKDGRSPHIVLYAKDNTKVIWGAEIGTWAQHLEARDEDKLASLYGYYKEFGTLLNGAKFINLREPRDKIPLPIDKY
jgi:hypothetical protein